MATEIVEIENNNQVQNGYASSRHNALRHGILSRHTILPWENQGDYDSLIDSLEDEYQPATPTESHLVEELAGIVWRKARVRLAEGSAFRKEAAREIAGASGYSTPTYIQAALVTSNAETKALSKGVKSLADDVTDAEAKEASEALTYWEERQIHFESNEQAATAALLDGEDKADWVEYRKQSIQSRQEMGYAQFSEDKMFADWLKTYVDYFRERVAKHQHAPAIHQQIIGLSYATERMDGIARYETHLDRKFERVLAMLLKLKDMNRTNTEAV